MRTEENMLTRSTEGCRRVPADGTVMLDLQGRFGEFSVARIGADGRVTFEGALERRRRAFRAAHAAAAPAVWEDR